MTYSKEKMRAYNAKYYAGNREKLRAQQAAYRATHSEEQRAYMTSYSAAHSEEKRVRDAAYRATHREEIRAYRAANTEKARAALRQWQKNNPGTLRVYAANRRAAKIFQRCTCCSNTDIKTVYDSAALCGRGAEVDHTTPLRLGGPHCVKNLIALTFEAHKDKTKTDAQLIAGARRRSRLLLQWTRPEVGYIDAPNSVNRAVFDRFSADVRLWRLA